MTSPNTIECLIMLESLIIQFSTKTTNLNVFLLGEDLVIHTVIWV